MSLETAAEPSWLLYWRLHHLESSLRSAKQAVEPLTLGPDLDACLVQHLKEQVGHLRAELPNVVHDIVSMEQEDKGLLEQDSNLDKAISDLSLQIRRLLSDRDAPPSSKKTKSGIKLPKRNVQIFDGNTLNWKIFWQEFDVAIHSKAQLDDTKKLAYLRDALKDRPAKHTRAILDAPSSKDGNSKELRLLYNVAKQYLCALKVMKYETFDSLVTLILELKLDQATMFKWQRHTQSSKTVSGYDDLLEFLDFRARAGENGTQKGERKRQVPPPERKTVTRPSNAASVEDNCVACKTAKHPFYRCKVFYEFPQARKMTIVRDNGLCLNCLRPGHFAKQCSSVQKCKKFQKPTTHGYTSIRRIRKQKYLMRCHSARRMWDS